MNTRRLLFLRYTAALLVTAFSACVTEQRIDSNSDVQKRMDLEGRSLSHAFQILGTKPISDDITPASKLGGEFYTPVNLRFPPNALSSQTTLIREVRWKLGDQYVAVICVERFGQWHVFDSVEWNKRVVF